MTPMALSRSTTEPISRPTIPALHRANFAVVNENGSIKMPNEVIRQAKEAAKRFEAFKERIGERLKTQVYALQGALASNNSGQGNVNVESMSVDELKMELVKLVQKVEELKTENKRLAASGEGKGVATKSMEEEYDRLLHRQLQLIPEIDKLGATDPTRQTLQRELDDIERTIDRDFGAVQEARERAARMQEHEQMKQLCEGGYKRINSALSLEGLLIRRSPLLILVRMPQLMLTRSVVDMRQLAGLHVYASLEELKAVYFSISQELRKRGQPLEGPSAGPQVNFVREFLVQMKRQIRERETHGLADGQDPASHGGTTFALMAERYSNVFEKGDKPAAGSNMKVDASQMGLNFTKLREMVELVGYEAFTDEQLQAIVNVRDYLSVGAPSIELWLRVQKLAQANQKYRQAQAKGFCYSADETSYSHVRDSLAAFGGCVAALSDAQLAMIKESSAADMCITPAEHATLMGQTGSEIRVRQRMNATKSDPLDPVSLGTFLQDPEGGQRSHPEAAERMSTKQLQRVVDNEFGCVAGIPNSMGHSMLQRACLRELKARKDPTHPRHKR